MKRDFYYSKKMQNVSDWLDYLEGEKCKRHTVNIDGENRLFTLQIEHGKQHSAKWEDMIFVGSAEESAITYKFQ